MTKMEKCKEELSRKGNLEKGKSRLGLWLEPQNTKNKTTNNVGFMVLKYVLFWFFFLKVEQRCGYECQGWSLGPSTEEWIKNM